MNGSPWIGWFISIVGCMLLHIQSIWSFEKLHITSYKEYTLQTVQKCVISFLKCILFTIEMHFIYKKYISVLYRTQILYPVNIRGLGVGVSSRGCILRMHFARSITLDCKSGQWSSGCVASFLPRDYHNISPQRPHSTQIVLYLHGKVCFTSLHFLSTCSRSFQCI